MAGPPDSCPRCTDLASIANCQSLDQACTSPGLTRDVQCSACKSGYRLDPSDSKRLTCIPCRPIDGCVSSVTCATSWSHCTKCQDGRYIKAGGDTADDSCESCAPVSGCSKVPICTGPSDSKCGECISGQYVLASVEPHQCLPCTPVQGCATALTCTAATDSRCSTCENGRYLDESGPASRCLPCATPQDIPNCAQVTACQQRQNAVCSKCADGYFLDGQACAPCTPVPGCAGSLTCTAAGVSKCSVCVAGHYLAQVGAAAAGHRRLGWGGVPILCALFHRARTRARAVVRAVGHVPALPAD
jgi:hypothetical protein